MKIKKFLNRDLLQSRNNHNKVYLPHKFYLKYSKMSKRTGLSKDENCNIEGLLTYLESQKESLDFLLPFDQLQNCDYSHKIRKPMDMFTLKKNLKASKYNSPGEFFEDLILI